MIKLKWHRDGTDWVATGEGCSDILWRIEQVWSEAPKGYGWYIGGLEDGGYYDSIVRAKDHCQARTDHALKVLSR